MKLLLGIGVAIIAWITIVTAFSDSKESPDALRNRQKLITKAYLEGCFKIIEDGSTKAKAAWTKNGAFGEMKASFVRAQQVPVPEGGDPGAAIRFKKYLQEGIEFFDSADDEWTMLRDFAGAFVAGTIDFSGGMGIATGFVVAAKAGEYSSDDAEKREFIEAEHDLKRYMGDQGYHSPK